MAQEKIFSGAFYGYQKNQVDEYVKKLNQEMTKKDQEIADLKQVITETQHAYDLLKKEVGNMNLERQKIANALVKAEEKADEIIKNVHDQAEKERKALEDALEKERERIVDMKKIVKSLKSEVVSMLQHFEGSISAIDQKIEES